MTKSQGQAVTEITPEVLAASQRALLAWYEGRKDFDYGARLIAGAVLRAFNKGLDTRAQSFQGIGEGPNLRM